MTNTVHEIKWISFKRVVLCAVFFLLLSLTRNNAQAAENTVYEDGTVYEFDKDSHYVLDDAASVVSASTDNTIGLFSISGNFTLDSSDDVSAEIPAYIVEDGLISLSYSFDKADLNTDESGWCIVDDKSKAVDDIKLESNIFSGALVLQTSLDGKNWYTHSIENSTDIFGEDGNLGNPFYEAVDIQLQNGCYYRVLIVYEMRIKQGNATGPLASSKNYSYKKVAEVYEFYAAYAELGVSVDDTPLMHLGSVINTGKDNGYSGGEDIENSDPHYGWKIGDFTVNGYTDTTSDEEGDTIFLKNVGDTVTLWFSLQQDITCLNGDSALYIADDKDGYDQNYGIGQTDFGQGTLIIQYTDVENVKHDPIIYTNYLAACTCTGADTRVQLFEEGDYEISLDYEVAKKGGPLSAITTYTDYKITFCFSVRNSNCMVYPFDVVTGSELSNHDITENGFVLDTANSEYLAIKVKRSLVTMGNGGLLIEDVRFDRVAKDGDQFTDEGMYTIVVTNGSTNESLTKIIYVGDDPYLTALSNSGYTIDELNKRLALGAVISEAGTIIESGESDALNEETEESPEASDAGYIVSEETAEKEVSVNTDETEPVDEEEENGYDSMIMVLIGGITVVAVIAVVLIIVIIRQRRKAGRQEDE